MFESLKRRIYQAFNSRKVTEDVPKEENNLKGLKSHMIIVDELQFVKEVKKEQKKEDPTLKLQKKLQLIGRKTKSWRIRKKVAKRLAYLYGDY